MLAAHVCPGSSLMSAFSSNVGDTVSAKEVYHAYPVPPNDLNVFSSLIFYSGTCQAVYEGTSCGTDEDCGIYRVCYNSQCTSLKWPGEPCRDPKGI